ncbi:MAG: helix-turn-helix transcriptional regulator [Sulfuritalea sp.]|jgi:DNA-binding CsgD family transcriptional regulator|nr:helix-turn-helix transcriptional regulator [Sulfuritalea sp.]
MTVSNDNSDRIHILWDELADFDAARADDALDHLMAGLGHLVDAQNVNWFGTVRMADILPGDPVHGWRPRCVQFLHPSTQIDASVKEQTKNLELGSADETAIRNVTMTGTFRANRAVDLAPGWLESDYYRRYFQPFGLNDVIWAGVPVNDDAECYFGIFRDDAHPHFTPEESDLVAYALRGLKWFCRQQLLSHGLMVATSPLTAVERQVLGGLLTGLVEKQIAAAQHQSPHTTHEYVSNIYRKFGVKNRAALMALWLGKAA